MFEAVLAPPPRTESRQDRPADEPAVLGVCGPAEALILTEEVAHSHVGLVSPEEVSRGS